MSEFRLQLIFHIIFGGLMGCIMFYGDQPLTPGIIGMAIAFLFLGLITRARGKNDFMDFMKIDSIPYGIIAVTIMMLAYGFRNFMLGEFFVNLPTDAVLVLIIGTVVGGVVGWVGQRYTKKKFNN